MVAMFCRGTKYGNSSHKMLLHGTHNYRGIYVSVNSRDDIVAAPYS